MMANEKKTQSPPPGGSGPKGGGPGVPRGGFAKPKNLKGTMVRVLGYVAARPLLLVLALACVAASAVASIAATYMMRPILNQLTDAVKSGELSLPTLLPTCLTLIAIYAVAALCTYLQANLMAQMAQKGCNRLRRDLFDKLQELPLSYFDGHPHGQLMSRFTNDADNVQMAMEQSVVQLLSSAITFVGVVSMMIYLSPILFLLTVAMLAAILLVFRTRGRLSREYYQRQQAALGAVNGNIQEMIEGMKVVKAFTYEEQAREIFGRLNEDYREAASRANYYAASLMPISASITNIGYAVTAAVGGFLALVMGLDIGGLAIYLQYNRQVTQPINQISMQMNTLLSALAGAERIFEVMDAQPEVDEGRVVLVPAEKDANGTLSMAAPGARTRVWAWRVPRDAHMALVPVLEPAKDVLIELGQADRRPDGSLVLLPPHQDSAEGVWVTVEGDGTLTQVADLSALSGHGWAWKYRSPDGSMALHKIRGTVRNVPGEDYYLTELRGAVRLTQVDFSYVEGKPVLRQVSVYANPGQKIAFVGSTGAGKTTVTNLINRFYEIQGGQITCDGIDVRAIAKDSLRLSQGAVLQDTHLFTGTVMDNIRYGRLDATDEDCIRAAKTANADGFIRRLPNGYQTMVTGDGGNLSQGQRQLLAIARAAVKDPPLMILDEATSSIDTRTEQLIPRGMATLREGRTVFVIAHRLSTVRNADCIVVIEGGRILEKGSHAELLEQEGRYHQLYTGQFELD